MPIGDTLELVVLPQKDWLQHRFLAARCKPVAHLAVTPAVAEHRDHPQSPQDCRRRLGASDADVVKLRSTWVGGVNNKLVQVASIGGDRNARMKRERRIFVVIKNVHRGIRVRTINLVAERNSVPIAGEDIFTAGGDDYRGFSARSTCKPRTALH